MTVESNGFLNYSPFDNEGLTTPQLPLNYLFDLFAVHSLQKKFSIIKHKNRKFVVKSPKLIREVYSANIRYHGVQMARSPDFPVSCLLGAELEAVEKDLKLWLFLLRQLIKNVSIKISFSFMPSYQRAVCHRTLQIYCVLWNKCVSKSLKYLKPI